ncbi:alpha/beta fold hydrolase [Roseomonas sp. AR75]|uniref:alpha/beta fold hydrolase n=1 Tax=Roseomonas sp. AR75 TaxID=2562311 RepID=UPI0010C06742|nr:alpha/beta fold hydrolase [Roseomonas sp. AR75]
MQQVLTAPAPIPPDMAALGETPAAIEAHVAGLSRRVETPCGTGSMVWRIWGEGAPMLLLHGGYGSWSHWIRNVLPLSRMRMVIAPDLPGMGESATPLDPEDAGVMADIVVDGLHRLLPAGTKIDLAGFSFGGVLGGPIAVRLGASLRRFVIVGSNGLGVPRAPMAPMGSWRRLPDRDARLAVHRQTLEVLMLANPSRIDPLALHLQERNAEAGRIRTPEISRTDILRRSLPALRGRLAAIWGEQDNIARGALELRHAVLREADPVVPFRVIPGAGHWVSYEAAEDFDRVLTDLLAKD